MKDKNYKIIFFIIIIALTIFSIYYIIKTQTTRVLEQETKITEINMDDKIIIGITKYNSLNPIISTSQDIQYISKLIFEPIIDITEDFRLIGGIASEWNKLNDNAYLIKLKEDKYWYNGEKLTAKDIEYTINYIKESESIYNANVNNIKNLEIINDYTIKININEPEENFEYMLCFPIICEEENMGSGSFYISKQRENELVLNSKQGDKELIIKVYNNMRDLYNAFSKEEIDIITTSNINYQEYIGKIGYEEKIICGREFNYLNINTKNKILSNPEVVEAIKFAINKNQIIYEIYNNLYIPVEFPLQYGSYLYNKNVEYEYNPNKAKQILKDNGWVYNKYWSKNNQQLKLEIGVTKEKIEIAETIKNNLEEIGIIADLKEISDWSYNNNLKKLSYDIVLMENTISIKPEIEKFVDFDIEKLENEEKTYENAIDTYNKKPNFIGLYFNPIIILHSSKLKGNFNANWYNIFYHIDSWYKINTEF